MAHDLADLDCQMPPGSRAAGVAISRTRWHDEGDSRWVQATPDSHGNRRLTYGPDEPAARLPQSLLQPPAVVAGRGVRNDGELCFRLLGKCPTWPCGGAAVASGSASS